MLLALGKGHIAAVALAEPFRAGHGHAAFRALHDGLVLRLPQLFTGVVRVRYGAGDRLRPAVGTAVAAVTAVLAQNIRVAVETGGEVKP